MGYCKVAATGFNGMSSDSKDVSDMISTTPSYLLSFSGDANVQSG